MWSQPEHVLAEGNLDNQGVPAQIAELRAAIDSLQAEQLRTLDDLSELEVKLEHVSVYDGEITGLSGPHLIIEGCNVHVRSGSGVTGDFGTPSGLGNLILGYNERHPYVGDRHGAHNLVIGRYHAYSSVGGLVAGEGNEISAEGASITGGLGNKASGRCSTVSGGDVNVSSGTCSSISGGEYNTSSAFGSAVTGGLYNEASGRWSTVSGGEFNIASGKFSAVSGGTENTATGDHATVSGGLGNHASGIESTVSGGVAEFADHYEHLP